LFQTKIKNGRLLELVNIGGGILMSVTNLFKYAIFQQLYVLLETFPPTFCFLYMYHCHKFDCKCVWPLMTLTLNLCDLDLESKLAIKSQTGDTIFPVPTSW